MSQLDQKSQEERVCGPKLPQEQDDDYDIYLFWPSLSNRNVNHNVSSADPPLSPLYGPVSLHSESTDFDHTELSSGPPSPITFAPTLNCQFPIEPDFGAPAPDTLGDEANISKTSEPEKYSPIFRMGLYFSQMTQLLDRAIEGVKIRIRKPKSQAP